MFLGTGLGIGFPVFWMTSTQIRLTLEELANTDGLTGIYNRRFFLSACEREPLRSSRTGESFSLIKLDVDHFKKIHDSDGHDTGDAVLYAVVEELRHAVSNIDTLARWGGEEFVALLPGVGAGGSFAYRSTTAWERRISVCIELSDEQQQPGKDDSRHNQPCGGDISWPIGYGR